MLAAHDRKTVCAPAHDILARKGPENLRKLREIPGLVMFMALPWRGELPPPFTARPPRLEPLRRASFGLVRSKQSGSQPANPLPRKCRTTTQGPECYAMPSIQGSVAAAQHFQPLHHTLPFFVRASWASWTFQYFQCVVAAQFGFAIPGKLGTLLAE